MSASDLHTPLPWFIEQNNSTCVRGTEELYSLVYSYWHQGNTIYETVAENLELADAEFILEAIKSFSSK